MVKTGKITCLNNDYLICLTCNRNIPKQKTPAQAVWKKLVIFPAHDALSKLNQLEKVLIS